MNTFFPEIKKNFGFGLMRLPVKSSKIDNEQLCQMVDLFIEQGFNYFDTAHGYHSGWSEKAVKTCLTSRYPRDKYLLVDKLTHGMFEPSPEGIRKFFQMQLDTCGVDYFDFYLMHAQNTDYYRDFRAWKAYETAFQLKAEGKVRHVGLSFHDKPELLEQILTDFPDLELVQLQFNYIDFDDEGIQARRCYEVCERFGKPVVVMEPVKGGLLANLPDDAAKPLRELGTGASLASYAIRFAASFPNNIMVLSGMSNLEQMRDNLSFMSDFKPLSSDETAAIARVNEIMATKRVIACTGCRYCTDGCPMNIAIPDIFSDLNSKVLRPSDWNSDWYFSIHIQNHGKPSECIECGQCESVCPQHLPIIMTLKQAAKAFEKHPYTEY
ncbi:MAG: aldo/keto reductase [Bacteroidales bacterium]|nr:aldo/keto reductase [Bacteroidales bacterium]